MTNPLFLSLPNIEAEELLWLEQLTANADPNTVQKFAALYSSRRQDPQLILILTCLGFVCVSGIQRFVLKQIGMGILYLVTGGLCVIGTIIDVVNYRKLAWEFNKKEAIEVAAIVGIR